MFHVPGLYKNYSHFVAVLARPLTMTMETASKVKQPMHAPSSSIFVYFREINAVDDIFSDIAA